MPPNSLEPVTSTVTVQPLCKDGTGLPANARCSTVSMPCPCLRKVSRPEWMTQKCWAPSSGRPCPLEGGPLTLNGYPLRSPRRSIIQRPAAARPAANVRSAHSSHGLRRQRGLRAELAAQRGSVLVERRRPRANLRVGITADFHRIARHPQPSRLDEHVARFGLR